MGRIAASVRVVALAVLVLLYGCGGRAANGGASGGSGPTSGGSGPTSGGSEGELSASSSGADSGATSAGSGSKPSASGGGAGGRTTKHCKTVDGKLAYGPIGAPQPLPLTTASFADCPSCSGVRDIFGFRTSAGYGFVWRLGFDPNAPGPNLFKWTAGSNFKGGEPLALVATNTAKALAIVPAPNGFVAETCSLEWKPEWIQLNGDLDGVGGSSIDAPVASCGPSILWTGEVYLTSFTDSRGLVVASLDEHGALVGEQVLTAEVDERAMARFSKNGDRVLFVSDKQQLRQSWYGILDLHGALLGDVQQFREKDPYLLSDVALVARGDGWWVASNGGAGVDLTGISRDGLVGREQRLFAEHIFFKAFMPSAYGGSLLVANTDSGGQYYSLSNLVALIDDAGEIAYSKKTQIDGGGTSGPREKAWMHGVVVDPLRDLVVDTLPLDRSDRTLAVQEYGCLD